MPTKTKRTPIIERQIIDLYEIGTLVGDLAKRFGMAERTIVKVLADNKVKPSYGDGKWYRSGVENTVSNDIKQCVKERLEHGAGARKIAKELGITRYCVNTIRDEFGIDTSKRTPPRIAYKATEKQCATCKQVKPIAEFRKRTGKYADGTERISYESSCLECDMMRENERSKRRAKNLRQNDPNYCLRKSVILLYLANVKQQ